MPKKIECFECQYGCGKYYKHKSSCYNHEKKCYANPNVRACLTCEHFIFIAQLIYDERVDNGPDVETYMNKDATCLLGNKSWKFNCPNYITRFTNVDERPPSDKELVMGQMIPVINKEARIFERYERYEDQE